MPTLYSCAVRQIRYSNCKPHSLCSPQMGLRIQGMGLFVVFGNIVFVLEVGGEGFGVLSSQLR